MPARLALAAALLLSLALSAPADAAPLSQAPVAADVPVGPIDVSDRAPATMGLTPRYIVELSDPPLAQWRGESPAYEVQSLRAPDSGRLDASAPAAQQYIAALAQKQQDALAAIQAQFPQAALHRQYQVVFNGLAVAVPSGNAGVLTQLRAIPGVARVYEDRAYDLHMFSSTGQIGADALWNSPGIGGQANAGAGVKIAIIDSGIKADNPFFNPEGYRYPEGFPKGETAHTTPKVIVARSYYRPDAPPLAGNESPEPGPEDSSHGTHTAGTAAGNAGTAVTFAGIEQAISGVAPRAYLLNYKAFYANDTVFSGSGFGVELIAAIEDAVKDGADVINNSWGGRAEATPMADPIARAADAAVDAGVVVVFSAGNEGPNLSTAGSPAFSDKLISVGAVTKAQEIAAGFVDVVAPEGVPPTLLGKPFGTAAFGRPVQVGDLVGPAAYLPVAEVAGSSLACEPLPAGSLGGRFALIERGTCPFSVKAYHAQLGGAAGVVIYNSAEGGEALINMGQGASAELVTIPAISVARSVGLALIEWRAQHADAAQLQIDARPRLADQTPDVLAAFSSRGPSFQGSLKPDVVAPGVNILSSGYGQGQGAARHQSFGQQSGTSMAAPHVAGAAALLRQLYPGWTTADVKSALMSTASLEVYREPGLAAGVLERGAGRINVDAAAGVGLLFDRPGVSFGSLASAAGQPTRATLRVTARNVSEAPLSYSLAARPTNGSAVGISVEPATISVEPGASASFNVTVEVGAGQAPGDYEGVVELAGNPQPLHLPVWARTLPAELGAQVLLVDNDGSSSLDLPDYAGYYGDILVEQNVSFHYRDVDALAGALQTLPGLAELQRYTMVLWFTGDNVASLETVGTPSPLTEVDQNLLIAYLQGGGNLIASGQNLADASDIAVGPPNDPGFGRSDLYHYYLGARFVQGDVFTATTSAERRVVGSSAQPWLQGIALDLSAPEEPGGATSAGNQASVDEVTVIDIDPRQPDLFTTPILQAEGAATQEGGAVGLNRFSDPSLETPEPGLPYRSTYLAFGLEGVREETGATTRKQLLQAILYWTIDRPSVTLSGPAEASAGAAVAFSASAQSNTPTSVVRYRWDWGDGSAIEETTEPQASHTYAAGGSYTARVEVTNTWGHRALGSLPIVVSGGAPGGAGGLSTEPAPRTAPVFRRATPL